MKLIPFLLLFLSFQTWAQKSISAQVFQVNVKPILQGIVGDFYQMIGLFPHYPKSIIQISNDLQSLENEKEILLSSCSHKLDQNCLSAIDQLRRKILPIEALTAKVLQHKTFENTLYLDQLSGQRILREFYSDLIEFQYKLNNASLFLKSKVRTNHKGIYFVKLFDQLQIQMSLAVVEFVPMVYKAEFKNFYSNFIHPIEKHRSQKTSHQHFSQNISHFNFSINLLNQNLTKRNKKTPEGMAPYLSVIHNRWNSILRYYL